MNSRACSLSLSPYFIFMGALIWFWRLLATRIESFDRGRTGAFDLTSDDSDSLWEKKSLYSRLVVPNPLWVTFKSVSIFIIGVVFRTSSSFPSVILPLPLKLSSFEVMLNELFGSGVTMLFIYMSNLICESPFTSIGDCLWLCRSDSTDLLAFCAVAEEFWDGCWERCDWPCTRKFFWPLDNSLCFWPALATCK